ncbi:dihydroorotase [Gulosibacter sp. 10]|uniref:dihydroorotase n=1 Tax=Gulosibacter sp. 10 TaxID=1255570 RepID=UPI00097E82F9|nr:dihydroorotase [Gulosibacter sp. 10]SJM53834.1 Dihydroorotase [Gulosibacter sp. 10]
MTTILIRGAKPYGEDPRDILIEGGAIAEIAAPGTIEAPERAEIVDASGLIALPGLVDLHVHLREPGFESSETVLTGSRAAAKGGFTTIFAMPNTKPVQDSAGVVESVWALGRDAGYADVHPIGAVTVGQDGEQLAELGSMADSRARVRVFSDDGRCVFDPLIMRRALEYVKSFDGVVAQHAQEPKLTVGAQMNEGALSAELGLGGWPESAETSIVARDALLAEQVGSRVHVCHLSTATAVDVVRWAKARGIAVTAEVTPHHLLLTEEKVRGFDARFKVNPPLRTDADVEVLRQALADGTIDVVGTDHAPHPMDSKQKEWDHASMGMVGLESALRIVQLAMVETGLLDWRGVARVMSEAPARIGAAGEAGRPLAAGEPANLVLYDAETSSVFTEDDLAGKSVNSPYLGLELPGSVRHTIYRGTFTVRDGRTAPEQDVARASRTRIAESGE